MSTFKKVLVGNLHRPPSNPHPQQRLTGLPQLPSEYILGRCALYNIAIEYTVILAQKESTHESCVVPTSVYISVCACLPSYSIPCHGFVWFCMVWCGFVWFCMVLYDFVWFCMMYWHCHSWNWEEMSLLAGGYRGHRGQLSYSLNSKSQLIIYIHSAVYPVYIQFKWNEKRLSPK